MPGNPSRPVLILFAKAPLPGQVKTRLLPELNPDEAAQVATELIEHTARLAEAFWPGPIVLCTWPDTDHPLFQELARTSSMTITEQESGDLGQKMNAALTPYTSVGTPAAVMGCDVPHCPADILRDAGNLLEQGRDVIGPSMDGGYYLIGLQRPLGRIFDSVDWGSNSALRTTLANALDCGVRFEHLPPLQDVDSYTDLVKVAEHFPDLRKWIKR